MPIPPPNHAFDAVARHHRADRKHGSSISYAAPGSVARVAERYRGDGHSGGRLYTTGRRTNRMVVEIAHAAGVSEDSAVRVEANEAVPADAVHARISGAPWPDHRAGKCSASAAAISTKQRRVGADIAVVRSMTPPGRRCPSNGTSTTTWPCPVNC